jgi:ABC-type transporter MlaC component
MHKALALPMILFAVTAHAAVPDTSTPKGVVETIIEGASHLDDKAAHAENARTIEGLVDFQKLANDALGSNASAASAAQKKEIAELLKGIITRTVYPEAPKFFRDVTVDYTAESKTPQNTTHITSVVTKGSKRSTVEYWLAPENNSYKVVDLSIEGERWVENVHDQFDEIIGKKGVSGLIQKMKKRLHELESDSKK